jgi:nucleotide-binding universal stress UspA family protein
MYQRVVVPLDGSQFAESILPLILQIAGPLDFEVSLVRVARPDEPAVAGPYLEGIARQLASQGVRVRSEVRKGDPAEQIVAAARETRADLIAMTTKGHGAFARLLLGSVAEAVLRTAEVPVFLFRQVERKEGERPRP